MSKKENKRTATVGKCQSIIFNDCKIQYEIILGHLRWGFIAFHFYSITENVKRLTVAHLLRETIMINRLTLSLRVEIFNGRVTKLHNCIEKRKLNDVKD